MAIPAWMRWWTTLHPDMRRDVIKRCEREGLSHVRLIYEELFPNGEPK